MANSPYKIELGIQLDTSDLQQQVNAAGDKITPIDIKVDAETKELTKTINNALKVLSSGGKNTLTLDTSKLEASLNDVNSTIKEIKVAMGTLDSGSGMKSLVGSINSISTALDKASAKFDELVGDLKSLSGKDFSLNFGINLGGSNPIARQSAYGNKARNDTLPQLKQQMNALVKYYNDIYKDSVDEFAALQKLVSGTKLGTGDFFQSFLYGKDSVASRMGSGSLSSQMQAYKQYIDMFKQAASLKGLDITSVTSQFSKSADQLIQDAQDIQTGAKEMDESFEKLKQIFGGGNNLNVEGLSAQLDSIVADLNEIRFTLESLSQGVSLDGLTSSFDRLSGAIENLLANAEKVKGVLGSGFDGSTIGSVSTSTSTSSAVKSAQQTGQKIGETVKQSVKQSLTLDDVIDEQVLDLMDKFAIAGGKGSKAFDEIRQAVVECRAEINTIKNSDIGVDEETFDTSRAIDKVTDAIANQHRAASELNTEYVELANYMTRFNDPKKGNKVRLPDFVKQEQGSDYTSNRGTLGIAFNTERGISFVDFVSDLNHELGQTIDLTKGEDAALDELLRKVEIGRQQRDALQKSGNYRASTASTEEILEQNGIDRNEIYDDVMSIVSVMDTAEQQIAQSSAEMASEVAQSGEKIEQSFDEIADAAKQVSKVKIGNTELDALNLKDDVDEADKLAAALSKLKSIQGSIDKIEVGKIDISKGVTEIQTLERQLESLSAEYNETVAEIKGMGGVSAAQLQSFQNDIDSTNRKIEQLQSNLREKIQTAIGTNVARDVQKAHSECGKLLNKSDELRQKLQMLDDIRIELETEKEQGDIQKLSELYTRYLSILKDVNTQIDINKRAEQDAHRKSSFELDKERAMQRLKGLFSENSEAARKFGSELDRLQKELNECGDTKGLQRINKEITNLGAKVKSANVKTQTFGQDLKSQFSKYSSYFSVASAFMYVEQGLRSMFEQVKLIDSAMTELKKVTDETDASYNKFLSNAAKRSKELGTTIDGLVGSTADFARLGYSFEDAQGLAEVANIYAVVGDDIEGVEGATESLISTLAAFKEQAGGVNDTDFAMKIIDIYNELGNKFAISSGGLGEALERSASSLAAANNTLEESASLITAANEVVQNPEKVGNAMKTISMRMKIHCPR